MHLPPLSQDYHRAVMFLRVGVSIVFIVGGISKLSLLLDSTTHAGMVANYMGSSGYINALFQDYLFGGLLTPAFFLTALSSFELCSGIALLVGFWVRPLALIYAFLLWTFVVSLPVLTVPEQVLEVKTYTSPAAFVQIRDISLSGFMFILYNLGPGAYSVDARRQGLSDATVDWQSFGLLLRFSLAMTFIVGGFFGAYSSVNHFAVWQPIIALLGLAILFGNTASVRVAGGVTVLVMLWYAAHKLNADKSLIGNLNGFKREFALSAAGIVLACYGGGERLNGRDLWIRKFGYLTSVQDRQTS